MSASDSQSTDQLDFVTMQGLLTYGEVLAQRTSSGRFVLPPPPAARCRPATARRRSDRPDQNLHPAGAGRSAQRRGLSHGTPGRQ
jgi:hypothetical protein